MSAKSAIENSLAQHLPLMECMRAMWVRPGTLAAKVLLDRCESMLAQARVVHEAEAEGMSGVKAESSPQRRGGRRGKGRSLAISAPRAVKFD